MPASCKSSPGSASDKSGSILTKELEKARSEKKAVKCLHLYFNQLIVRIKLQSCTHPAVSLPAWTPATELDGASDGPFIYTKYFPSFNLVILSLYNDKKQQNQKELTFGRECQSHRRISYSQDSPPLLRSRL